MRFTVGDVIRKARHERRWNQQRLGTEAAKFALPGQHGPVDKGTVSKIERDPYGSKFGTVWRLLAALALSLTDVEREIGTLRQLEDHVKPADHRVRRERSTLVPASPSAEVAPDRRRRR